MTTATDETLIDALGYAYGLLPRGTEGRRARDLISELLAWPRELVSSEQIRTFAAGFLAARKFRREHPGFFQ